MSAAGTASLTAYGKEVVARSMYEKGKAFLAAAILLRQRGGYEYAVLHLICQGIEVLGKGYLLMSNYDHFKPKLRSYGHNLLRLAAAVESEAKIRILRPRERSELESLIEASHREFLCRHGKPYLGTQPSTKRLRITQCYSCKTYLTNELYKECRACEWRICSCGACGCAYGMEG